MTREKKISLHIWVSQSTDERLRNILKPYRKGLLSEFIEEAILEKLEQRAERMQETEPTRKSSKSEVEEIADRVEEELKNSNRLDLLKREIYTMAAGFGAISTRTQAAVLKALVRRGVIYAMAVRGNIQIYRVRRQGWVDDGWGG